MGKWIYKKRLKLMMKWIEGTGNKITIAIYVFINLNINHADL